MIKKKQFFSHEVRVGLAVFIGCAIVVAAILSIGERQGLLLKRYHLYAHMSRVEGLQAGAPVRLAGVRVGSVTSVKFSPSADESKIVVELEVDESVKERIRKDSIAHIGTLGLLGDKYVGISMGSLDQPVLKEGDLIQASDPLDVEKLIEEGAEVFDRLKSSVRTLDEIATKINTGQGTVGKLINDPNIYFDLSKLFQVTNSLADKIESGEGTMARLFEDPKLYDYMTDLISSTNALVDSLHKGRGSVARIMSDSTLYTDAAHTITRLNSVLQKLESNDGSLGLMMNDRRLYEQLNTLTMSLDSLVKDIKADPKRYLKIGIF